MVAVGVGEREHDRLVRQGGDGLVQVRHPGARVDDEGPVVAFHDIHGLVVHQVAVALPGVVVDLAEDDVGIAADELLGIVAGVLLRLPGAPGHDGQAVAEVRVQTRTVQVRRLRDGGPGLHFVQQRLHVPDVSHTQFAALGEVEPVLLPVVSAIDFQFVFVHPALPEHLDQVRNRGDIAVEAVLIEDPDAMAGADGIAREQQVLPLEEIDHRTCGMAGNGDCLHFHAAQVEDFTLVDETEPSLGEPVGKAHEIGPGERETDILVLQEGRKHPRMVAVVMGEGDGDGLAGRPLGHQGAQRFRRIVRPVHRVGQVDDQRFLVAHDEVNVGAVVEMREFSVRIERLAGRVFMVVILDVIDILADDGHRVGADLDVFGGVAGHHGQRQEQDGGVLFHNGHISSQLTKITILIQKRGWSPLFFSYLCKRGLLRFLTTECL